MGYMDAAMRMRDELGAMPFVVRRKADGKIVGSTRYFNVDAKNRRLEIGHTWHAQRARLFSWLHRYWLKTSNKPVWHAESERAHRELF